jgi:hypothetical protein
VKPQRSELCRIMDLNFAEFLFRDRPKSLGSTPGVALQTTAKALLDPFRPPHNVRIRFRSLPRTPFRTVSEGAFSEVRCSKLPTLVKP